MYSKEIMELLNSRKIEPGDKVKVTKAGNEYEGILMPRIELGDHSCIVVKLSSGYNIGISYSPKFSIALLEKGKPVEFKASESALEKQGGKDEVHILGCGGTIAARVEYKTGGVFPAFSPSDLLTAFPELGKLANIKGKKLFDLLSEDMTPGHWKIIAEETQNAIKDGAKGVILMHGTDTMHYTSAALSFMLQNPPVPIILVGAQRSSDRGSSDNKMNLVCSTLLAKSDIAEIGICMHANMSDDYCAFHKGTKVRKLHTSRRDAFQSVNASPIANIYYLDRTIKPLTEYRKRSDDISKMKLDTEMNENVAMLNMYPGIKPKLIESLSEYDGAALGLTGLGNAPTNPKGDKFAYSVAPAIKSLIDSGVVVVGAPQTIYGRMDMNVYTAGRILDEIGVIGNHCDWLPETAFVKLMHVLAKTKDQKKAEELMLENTAGEISERSVIV